MSPDRAPETSDHPTPRARVWRSVPGVVITAIAGLTTLTLGIFLIIGYGVEARRRQTALEAEAARTANELATSLALPAWNFDQPQAEKILDSVMQDPQVLQVWVTTGTSHPETYARYRNVKWEPVASDHPPMGPADEPSDAITLERPISASGAEIGSLHLRVTRRFLRSELHQLLRFQLTGLAALSLLLAGGLYALLRWIVLRPLVEIGRFAHAVSLGQATAHSGVGSRYLDELSNLRSSVGRTLQLSEDRYALLQASEERFRTLIDSAPEAIITYDLDLESIVEANPHAALLFGCTLEALKAGRLQDFYEPVQPDGLTAAESIRSHSLRAMAGEELEFERTLMSRDGHRRVCSVHLVKLPSHERRLVRATFIDITARKQAELGLQHTLQELVDLKTALDMSAIVSITNSAGDIIDVNDQFCRVSGYSREEVLGKNHRIFASDYHPAAYYQELWSTISRGQVWRNEIRNRSKQGNLYWFDITIVPLRDAEGLPARYMAIQVDITERKQHEESLRKLSQVVEQSPVSILIADIHGVIEYANPAVHATSGFSPEEVLGQSIWLFQMTGLDQAQDQNLWKCLKAGREWRGTTTRKKRNGDPLVEAVIISRVKDDQGKAAHFLCLKEDITARMKAEEDRGQLEMQLFHAQKMEALGQLAGGVAHDMNNMLTAVMGHLELLKMKVPGNKDVVFHANAIALAADRSKDIVAKVLAFSRKQVIAPKVLDLNEHIATTRETIGPLIGEDIRMSFWPAPGLWPINVDPSQIDQIVMNLAVNARDAMPNGGELAMETANRKVDASFCERHSQAVPGSYVVLSVRDIGIGIDQATLTRIFEPFFTTKAPGKGTGLGLSTVFGIAKQNDGFVTVTSQVGKGTTFEVFLPRYGAPAEAPVPEEAEPATLPPASAHILLVEDDPLLRNVVERLLLGLGHSVRTTDSPVTALQIAEHETTPIDLLLTDVIMPDLNGRELMERFRELRPGVPTLFMSGYSADIIAKKGILEEGIHLLAKPFTRATLAKHLDQILPRIR